MTPYKPKKSTPVQDTSDEEDMFEEEEMSYRILTPLAKIGSCATKSKNHIITAKSNSQTSAVSKAANNLKQSRKNRKMLNTEPMPEIEIKMTPHTPKNSSVHYTSEDEDIIIYVVDESLMDWNMQSGFKKFLTPTKNGKK
ncbi:hypothetical protein TNCV_3610801 [Trichonephila clavipes]|nr:hypothetical protein TNCV_3610801 [Trichonephila clavipes]